MKKVKAEFRAAIYKALQKTVAGEAAKASRGFEGIAKENAPKWALEIEFELESRIRREVGRLQRIAQTEAE